MRGGAEEPPVPLYEMMVAQLRDDGFSQLAKTMSRVTTTPIDATIPRGRLLLLIQKGLAAERDEEQKGTSSLLGVLDGEKSLKGPTSAGYGLYGTSANTKTPDFSGMVTGESRGFPTYQSKVVIEHKNVVRCARFSPDGRMLATGSADTSIRLVEVDAVRQYVPPPSSRDGGKRDPPPIFRHYYDHTQVVNDLDFHPQSTILISGARDNSIKFFDFSKTSRKAYQVIQDTDNVRSVAFHPCGDYFLAGTEHPIAHLYDVNTFQCFLSSTIDDEHHGGAINQVRYSSTGALYATGSKDGAVRVWDGANAQCVRVIGGAHAGSEATSVAFTRDQRYVLSCGTDYVARLWEVSTGRQVKEYEGARRGSRVRRMQACFSADEGHVVSLDESTNTIVVWDALTAEVVASIPSGHSAAPKWLEVSPSSGEFATCGMDRAVRLWYEQ
eukprot:TRINITY_DN2178_c0_g1_i1.p1 TRINITY_DN2178_c0_g1~~TRINITY_DN2178_c0_g1_i1.p1  ORF type:complete len:440 (-),score=58.31 TRINITY_DN2178_c0_g1_i1:39-1358(-)